MDMASGGRVRAIARKSMNGKAPAAKPKPKPAIKRPRKFTAADAALAEQRAEAPRAAAAISIGGETL